MRGRRVLLVDSPESAQTYFWIANVGVNKRYPQHAALDLVNTLYGGRFTSILNTELRIKSGLSYSARAGFTRTHGGGRVRHPLVHGHGEHRQGARSLARDADAPEARRRDRGDARLRARATCSASIR